MKSLFLPIFFLVVCSVNAQQWVSTNPENKRALIEQFTGVRCAGCPAGSDEVDQLLQAHPNKLFAVEYHQPNTPFCAPYGNDQDFRRSFLAAYCNPSFNFIGAYPTAFINRRMWPNESYRNFFTTNWESDMLQINTELSPLNIGLHPLYDAISKVLTVEVEIYYTSTVSDPLTLYVQFSESGLHAIQDVAGTLDSSYTHKRVFREALCAQWGDPLSNTTQGTLYTATYTYSNAQNLYDMANCQVLVFVRNSSNEEIVTVNGGGINLIFNSVSEHLSHSVSIYPNPANVNAYINGVSSNVIAEIFDVNMKLQIAEQMILNNKIFIDCAALPNGIYFLLIDDEGNRIWKKLIVQH
jgi:hypothetical protein